MKFLYNHVIVSIVIIDLLNKQNFHRHYQYLVALINVFLTAHILHLKTYGITASKVQLFIASRHVYVAELLEKHILVYERQDDNSLVLKQVPLTCTF